ncbi:MAG: sigma 54-interacting transcriptional regulator [Polaromonas sp.]
MQSQVVPDQPASTFNVRNPLVAMVFEEAESSDWRDLITNLNMAFSCSPHCLTSPSVTQPVRNAELVIWQRVDGGIFLPSNVAVALAVVAQTCPVIADNLDVIVLDLLGRNVADFLVWPCTHQALILCTRRVLDLLKPNVLAEQGLSISNINTIFVGGSAVLTNEVNKLQRYAACDAGVLILEETETRKEVFAQAIHYVSARATKPMVAVHCDAVPAELMEAELFGDVKGAYTNACMARTGLVSEAQGGTLFLDAGFCRPSRVLSHKAGIQRRVDVLHNPGKHTIPFQGVRMLSETTR